MACVECNGQISTGDILVVVGLILTLALLIGAFFKFRPDKRLNKEQKKRLGAAGKILFVFASVLSSLPMVFPFGYPEIFSSFLAFLVIPVDLSISLGFECMSDNFSFYTRLYTTSIVPVLVGGVIIAIGLSRGRPGSVFRARCFLVVTLIVYLLCPQRAA